MDTEAVLARHPEWALVDELAHTNVPGAKHAKRWQSVEELLEAGINVITTVNIQHLESLNDTVREITGVEVRETFPDQLIAEADEVVVVDLTPEALINRLRRGVVYDMEKVDRALVGFFTPERLAALRELALAADRRRGRRPDASRPSATPRQSPGRAERSWSCARPPARSRCGSSAEASASPSACTPSCTCCT